MKKYKLLIVFLLTVCTVAACATAQPQEQSSNLPIPQTEDQVPRINVEDAKAALDSGQAILVDVRSADSYAAGHAIGAISIPLDNFENNIDSLSLEKGQWIITYCT